MSLQAITVRCDWPGCLATEVIDWFPGCFHDHDWADREGIRGQHLCPKHSLHSWKEYGDEMCKIWNKAWPEIDRRLSQEPGTKATSNPFATTSGAVATN